MPNWFGWIDYYPMWLQFIISFVIGCIFITIFTLCAIGIKMMIEYLNNLKEK